MKAQLFSHQDRLRVFDDAGKFIDQVGCRNVREIQCGTDGIMYRITVYYTEAS